jgi:hypothetical protein
MALIADESLVNQLIDDQRSAIRYHLLFGIGIVILGAVVIIIGFVLPEALGAEGIKTLVGIGGGFVSSLSAFQLKEILRRKEKMGVFENVKIRLQKLDQEGKTADQTERTRIQELLWKLIEQTAMG